MKASSDKFTARSSTSQKECLRCNDKKDKQRDAGL